MPRERRSLVIDARPRGPGNRPLAGERVLGRPVLGHLLEQALPLAEGSITIHARHDEHEALQSLLPSEITAPLVFATGPPPAGATVLRADRFYDSARLKRALRRGRDPETAAFWRLDAPLGLAGAGDELIRRKTYQPLGRYWALGPARVLARLLRPTFVRPNALTLASGGLVLAAALAVAFAPAVLQTRLLAAGALAVALVLDTADGHLARLQGTASAFGRWLDGALDELGEMALHAGIAWAAFARTQAVAWLLVGMLYGMGKYLFMIAQQPVDTAPSGRAETGEGAILRAEPPALPAPGASTALSHVDSPHRFNRLRALAHLAGHADVRWHLWIVLAALGRLELALAAYAVYFPARAAASALRKAAAHA